MDLGGVYSFANWWTDPEYWLYSGVCESLPVQVVNDLFFIHERGKRIGYYTSKSYQWLRIAFSRWQFENWISQYVFV